MKTAVPNVHTYFATSFEIRMHDVDALIVRYSIAYHVIDCRDAAMSYERIAIKIAGLTCYKENSVSRIMNLSIWPSCQWRSTCSEPIPVLRRLCYPHKLPQSFQSHSTHLDPQFHSQLSSTHLIPPLQLPFRVHSAVE